MDRKTIVFILFCPVLLFSCSQQQESLELTVHPVRHLAGYVTSGPMFPVRIPDSLTTIVSWNSPVELVVVETRENRTVEQGDTLMVGSDPFLAMELDRLGMELQFAAATGDSSASDSLQALLSDSSMYIAVEAPVSGRAVIMISTGITVQPGDTIAAITGPPPDSVYIILPSEGHIRWPDVVPGCTGRGPELLCRGVCTGDSVSIPGVYRIEPRFVHEEGLRTFLLSTEGDTLDVTVTGSFQEFRTIYSHVQLDSIPLSAWD